MKKINDYGKLAVIIIDEFDKDKEESGRSEMEKSLPLLLDKYDNKHDLEVISDTLIALTGYSLKTLIERADHAVLDEEND